ncbi:hypothetical protein CWC46_01390 [Prodigiosinella confusarubida]|uniref:Uncharacterized protein n=1 Tax=Serratia sp. (strain ATCC 39006) TaxID=104623 RepID=A0A2I5T1Y5_SERS3|nr:hypothetical protein CWC46_01390 [Serratia sp. ATCC 39006]AUH02911.1 hypothetical protein Ser39006_001390 [Serratia sp. ATCC 39006]
MKCRIIRIIDAVCTKSSWERAQKSYRRTEKKLYISALIKSQLYLNRKKPKVKKCYFGLFNSESLSGG